MITDLWYKNAIIYSLDLETFMDSNGDGVGDFEGLIRRLNYLEILGVDVLWLAPFQKTPNRDNGYDVSDFYAVDDRHGSSGDFVEFMHQARKRGMRVIIDLVANHTSDQHRWFQEARRDPESRFRDWYVWSKKRPPEWNKGMVFPGKQKATWTKDKEAGLYYFHRFYEFQPDLNIHNPEVREELRRIIGFWLELSVSGFRVDAVPFLIEKPDGPKHELSFEYLRDLRDFTQWRVGDAMLLGEANVLPQEVQPYFDGGRGLHMMFNFWVNQHLFLSLATGEVKPLAEALRETRRLPATSQWAHFLRNHDELDLGRLDDDDRQIVFDRFGPDPAMQIFGRGIRRRLASMLGERSQLELAYSMLFALPGAPVLRYGDEIGMGEDLSLEGRSAVRTPMQWSLDPNAGFSTSERLVHPVIDEGPYGYRHVNVEDQRRDAGSLLRWMIRMIRLRKESIEVGLGRWKILPLRSRHVLGLCYTWENNSLVTLHNFSHEPQEVRFRLADNGERVLANLIDEEELKADARGTHRVMLNAYGYRWFRPGGLGYALRRKPTAADDKR